MGVWDEVASALTGESQKYVWDCGDDFCLDGSPHGSFTQQHSRKDQRLPRGDVWAHLLLQGGRGSGKSRSGAEGLIDLMLANPKTVDGTATEWLAAGATIQDAREIMALGPSGLVASMRRRGVGHEYNKSLGIITLDSGQRVHLRGGDDPDAARGLNLAGAWCDEIGTWRHASTAWIEGIIPALRQQLPNGHPRTILTTTPKQSGAALLTDLASRDDGTVVVRRASTFDNSANLSPEALAELKRRYAEGSRTYRVELLGEWVADVEGALWVQSVIDENRVEMVPESGLARVLVSVDPAATANGDATGIIVAGSTGTKDDRHYYVIADETKEKAEPSVWGKAAVLAWNDHDADGIVVEVNQGGLMAVSVLTQAARDLRARGVIKTLPKIIQVRASRGKATRAEPVSTLYDFKRVHHVGAFPELEGQLITWVQGNASPDRLDALVWCITALSEGKGTQGRAFVA